MPTPFATFSPLTMQTSTSSSLAQAGQQLLDRVATRTPDDVADEEDLHPL